MVCTKHSIPCVLGYRAGAPNDTAFRARQAETRMLQKNLVSSILAIKQLNKHAPRNSTLPEILHQKKKRLKSPGKQKRVFVLGEKLLPLSDSLGRRTGAETMMAP